MTADEQAEADAAAAIAANGAARRTETSIRPERFARLVTLASILIQAGRADVKLDAAEICERMQISDAELREDINVLNVVNFGGGSYVLYAEIDDEGRIEVDPEPYSDNFARPARLLPVEAKALVAAIDLIGEHLPEGSLASAREKIVAALGADPMQQGLHVADARRRRLGDRARRLGGDQRAPAAAHWTTTSPTRTSSRRASSSPTRSSTAARAGTSPRSIPSATTCATSAWTASATPRSPTRPTSRARRSIRPAELDGWLRTGEVEASRIARVWVSPERARWAREERRVAQELADGSVIVEHPFKGTDFLVRDILGEAGDAAVLEPAEAREAVLAAVERLRAAAVR